MLSLFKSIDLSSNNLTREVLHELTNLSGLLVLNLSRNNFLGKLPKTIGDLTNVESLDIYIIQSNLRHDSTMLVKSNLTLSFKFVV